MYKNKNEKICLHIDRGGCPLLSCSTLAISWPKGGHATWRQRCVTEGLWSTAVRSGNACWTACQGLPLQVGLVRVCPYR